MDLEGTLTSIAPGLLRYCIARTGDPSLAEEIAQDALTVLVERFRRGDEPRSPEGLAFTIARRRAARAMMKRRLLSPLDAVFNGHAPGPGPEEQAVERDRFERVQSAVGKLSKQDREALLLVAAGEVSTETGAELLGISPSAFKMRLHRARKRLAGLVEVSSNGTGH